MELPRGELEEAMTKTILYMIAMFILEYTICPYTYVYVHCVIGLLTVCTCGLLSGPSGTQKKQHSGSKKAPCWKCMWNRLIPSVLAVKKLKPSYSTRFASTGKQEIKRTTNS